MHWKVAIGTAALTAVLTLGVSSDAQGPARGTVVAVCNLTEVFSRVQFSAALEGAFGNKKKQIEAEALKRRDEITRLQTALEAFQPGSPDFIKRRDEIIDLQVKAEIWIRQKETRLRDKHKEYFEKVYSDVRDAVAELARANGYDVVLTDNPIEFAVPDIDALIGQIRQKNVIYAAADINLTADVIQRLDQAFEQAGGAAQIKVDI